MTQILKNICDVSIFSPIWIIKGLTAVFRIFPCFSSRLRVKLETLKNSERPKIRLTEISVNRFLNQLCQIRQFRWTR